MQLNVSFRHYIYYLPMLLDVWMFALFFFVLSMMILTEKLLIPAARTSDLLPFLQDCPLPIIIHRPPRAP